MAGYMTKCDHLYEGELVNGASAAVANGVMMVPGTSTDKGKLVFPANADTTSKFLCKEATTIFDNITAYRFIVTKLNDAYYFVEENFDLDESNTFDETTATTAVGAYLRAHPVHIGDEFVTTKVTGTISAGTAYGVKTDGTIG